MTYKNVFSFCFPIVLFLVFVSENLKAQSNSHQDLITDKAIVKSSSNPVLVQIPGGYRVEVENNPLINKNQTALEVIRAIPGVFIRDSTIEVGGKKDLLIQINGFDVKLEASLMIDYLSTISGENIKEVEVIRNPSAKYSSLTGSVINIILQKQIHEGIYGNIKASLGNVNKGYAGSNLYIVRPQYDFSVSVAENYNQTFNTIQYSYRTTPFSSGYGQTMDNPKIELNNPLVNMKYNYKINDNHVIGIYLEYWGNSYSTMLANRYTQINSPLLIQNIKKHLEKSTIGFYTSSRFKNQSQLDLQFNTTIYNVHDRYLNHSSYADPNFSMYTNDKNEKYIFEDHEYTFKSIYKFNISKKILLESGAELIYSKFNDHFRDSTIDYDKYSVCINRYFIYNEYVIAPFLNLNISFRKWNYTIGLRDEYCLFKYSQNEDNNTYVQNQSLMGRSASQNHGDANGNYLYPNSSLSYKINEKQMLILDVKQVNTRPGLRLSQSMDNPFSTYLLNINKNSITYRTSLADVSYILQPSHNQMYMLNGGVSFSKSSTVIIINSPISSSGSFYYNTDYIEKKMFLSLSSQNNINKWFSLGTSFFVADIKNSIKNNTFDLSIKNPLLVALSLNGNIRLPEKINFKFSYQYTSSYKTTQGNNCSTHYLNLVFNRLFFNQKIESFLAISNPYHRMKSGEGYNSPFDRQYKEISEAAVFRLGASYKFGKTKRATIQKQNAIRNTRM